MRLAAVVGLGLVTAGAAAQQRPGAAANVRGADVPAVNVVQPGKWLLRDADGNERPMCLRDPYQILRPSHATAVCQRVLLESAASRATVRNVCAGHGTMLTRITVDTPRQVSLDVQGVIDGQPFSETYEARRVGECS
ncbi:hypothetical protein ATB93_13665 [Sphingomonas sp. WG]|jgi:hypothetical protein|nr:hypothetical protein ATB93_13665 [Sphingomonas sp. WG]